MLISSVSGVAHEMERITIASDQLVGNTKYRLIADVTTPGSDVGSASVDFWVADSPSAGTCTVASDQGIVYMLCECCNSIF